MSFNTCPNLTNSSAALCSKTITSSSHQSSFFGRCVELVRHADHSREATHHTTVLAMCHVVSDSPRNYSWEAAANRMSRMFVLFVRIVHRSETRCLWQSLILGKNLLHKSQQQVQTIRKTNHPRFRGSTP